MANGKGKSGSSDRVSESLLTVTAMKLKKHLLLERKAMTNLDSVLKTRGFTLLSGVCIVKAMVWM